ncbi:MAG: hypothetical protein JXD23_06680 [Spirochaetales bacterium]|nr:hypothetical protein [Spirochaetales bacterium]
MAEGKKPGIMIFAGVIEIVFSIIIIFYALIAGLIGALMGAVSAAGSAMSMMSDSSDAAIAAAAGPGAITMIVSIILAIFAIVLGIIGIIGAANLFKGKKAGVGLSNFWAIGLFIVFAVGLVVSIIQMASFSSAASALTEAANNMADTNVTIDQAQMQAGGAALGIGTTVANGFIYLLPAVLVFIFLKLKPVKDYLAAPQA